MDIPLIITCITTLGGAVGFMETRMSNLKNQIKEKMEDREDVARTQIESVKEDISKLETKIDLLITNLIRKE